MEEGDIAGAGHWLELQYDEALDKWVLQNPAKGISPLNGVPVGTVEYFAMATPPTGYLKADGRAVGRETYPELYTAIGTTFGVGDGTTTFNLPDLINRFAQGSSTPGEKVAAGLPNITGSINRFQNDSGFRYTGACFFEHTGEADPDYGEWGSGGIMRFDASRSNPIYGASDTVQPPALTLLPCIKAFDAATNPGLINITGLANDVDKKLDKMIDSKPVRYVIDAYNDGTAYWYRKWSDGWLEQGGTSYGSAAWRVISLPIPFSNKNYTILLTVDESTSTDSSISSVAYANKSTIKFECAAAFANALYSFPICWYACGQGEQS